MPEALIHIFIFAVGASVGSFLNVCIYRIPLGRSVVSPGSRCPACESPVRFYDNIPILSYVALRGRCRSCNVRISPRYAVVEALNAILWVALYRRFGLTPELAVYSVFTASLVVITFIDIDHRIIPNVISLPGVVAGLLASVPISYSSYRALYPGTVESATGVALGGGLLLLIAAVYYLISGHEGMGMGDVKLLAMIGAFTGWKGVLFTLFAGSFAGALTGVSLMLFFGKKTKYAVPFGPFLSLGAVAYLLYGDALVNWYTTRILGL